MRMEAKTARMVSQTARTEISLESTDVGFETSRIACHFPMQVHLTHVVIAAAQRRAMDHDVRFYIPVNIQTISLFLTHRYLSSGLDCDIFLAENNQYICHASQLNC